MTLNRSNLVAEGETPADEAPLPDRLLEDAETGDEASGSDQGADRPSQGPLWMGERESCEHEEQGLCDESHPLKPRDMVRSRHVHGVEREQEDGRGDERLIPMRT